MVHCELSVVTRNVLAESIMPAHSISCVYEVILPRCGIYVILIHLRLLFLCQVRQSPVALGIGKAVGDYATVVLHTRRTGVSVRELSGTVLKFRHAHLVC